MNAKDLWNDLFDISLEKYRTEDCSIRNMAMLLHVFRLEFQKVTNYINDLQQKNEIQSTAIKTYEYELKNCNCKITARSPLKTLTVNKSLSPEINQNNISPKKINLSNISPKKIIQSNISPRKINLSNISPKKINLCNISPKKLNLINVSPKKRNESILSAEHFEDVFNDHISEVDANISKENDNSLFVDDSFSSVSLSTSPTLNNRKSRSFRSITRNQNLNNSSVIQGTPTLKVSKVKKFKQSKLPLSFCPTVKNCNDTDATFCFVNQKTINDVNNSGDDIDDLLDEINSVTPSSKRTKLLDNSYDRPTPTTHNSPKFAFKRDVVRKKNERLQMQGWDCPDCEKYYGGLNLPEDELKERMNKCSKHRDNFNPMRLTPEGFWNPDFTPTQNSFAFEL